MSELHPRRAASAPEPEATESTATARLSRSLVIAVWSTGPAAAYALLSLAHALLIERSLNVDVGFGRSLAYWVVSVYLALLLWGFLPRRPPPHFARPGLAYPLLGVGALGLLVCGGFTLAWLAARWNPSVGVPVIAALIVMLAAGVGTLWIADRTEPTQP